MSFNHFKTSIFTFILLQFVSTNSMGQKLEFLSKLPSIINESSGLETTGKNQIWTFNDAGGNPELFLIDKQGNLLKTLEIVNVKNRDWEDISKDDQGNFYIGNIGNNSNATRDLSIYKIPNPKNLKENKVSAKVISFSFEDQVDFPPTQEKLNFDCEAMFWFNENLYLFSKHRSFPMATNLYRLPAVEGHHIAKKIGTFYTGKDSGTIKDFSEYWVTSAAISPSGDKVCLLNDKKLWIFYNFEKDQFFNGDYKEINFDKKTQKEAVCFVSNDLLYISDEYWLHSNEGGNLYKLKLNNKFKEHENKN